MKAVTFHEYGPPGVLQVEELPGPEPGPEEILVRNHAASVNFGDLLVRDLANKPRDHFYMPSLFYWMARLMFGWARPRQPVLGSEFAGIVAAVGENVDGFAVGDRVYGYTGPFMGTHAEYVKLKQSGSIAKIPEGTGFSEAAVMPYGVVVASSVLGKIDIPAGAKVLLVGASGSIGGAALQLLRQVYGAEVTAVCSTPMVDHVRQLGADHIIDYRKQDHLASEERYDLIVDVLGLSPFSRCRQILNKEGQCIFISFKGRRLLQGLWSRLSGGPRLRCIMGTESPASLNNWNTLVDAGRARSHIDRTFDYTDAVAAHRYAESGDKRGSIALTFPSTQSPGNEE